MQELELATSAIVGAIAWKNPGSNEILFRFPNDYGASIIRHSGSYGTELAVIAFANSDADSWELIYDTPITDDVIGWLEPDTAARILGDIAALPRRKTQLDA